MDVSPQILFLCLGNQLPWLENLLQVLLLEFE